MTDLYQKLIKKSHVRLIKSGNVLELYEYENPYFYNFPPPIGVGKGGADSVLASYPFKGKRREDNLQRAKNHIRRIIWSNERAWGTLKFLTFTYKKNETDISRAFRDWSQFSKRLNRQLRSRNLATSKYIAVVEFQQRGSIHFHVLYFNLPHLGHNRINVASLWRKGFVHGKPVKKIRSIASYVSKYLQKQTSDQRLFGNKAYFTSRGLLKPTQSRKLSTIENYMTMCNTEKTYERVYIHSKYGFIRYSQLKNVT